MHHLRREDDEYLMIYKLPSGELFGVVHLKGTLQTHKLFHLCPNLPFWVHTLQSCYHFSKLCFQHTFSKNHALLLLLLLLLVLI